MYIDITDCYSTVQYSEGRGDVPLPVTVHIHALQVPNPRFKICVLFLDMVSIDNGKHHSK